MMGRKRSDGLAHEVFQLLRRDDGHAWPPGHQMVDDLEKAAGAEAHGERAVRLVAPALRRMEEKARASGAAEGEKRSITSCGASWNTPNERSA